MVHQLPIHIEIGGAGSIKSCKQLIADDQEFHLPRLLDKPFLHQLLKVRRLPSPQHPQAGVVLKLLLCLPLPGKAITEPCYRLVARDDSTLLTIPLLLKDGPVLKALIDTITHQHRIAIPLCQGRLSIHVKEDVSHDPLDSLFAAIDASEVGPPLL